MIEMKSDEVSFFLSVFGSVITYLSFSIDKIVEFAKLGDDVCKYCAKTPEFTEFTRLVVSVEYSILGLVIYASNIPWSGMVVCNDTTKLNP